MFIVLDPNKTIRLCGAVTLKLSRAVSTNGRKPLVGGPGSGETPAAEEQKTADTTVQFPRGLGHFGLALSPGKPTDGYHHHHRVYKQDELCPARIASLRKPHAYNSGTKCNCRD